ncbi:hypothetical protein B0T20DRAFT_472448 [Sordaria brevicollis]|uniref:2EXR domain-containing protein n=1 Tax=Sordaria brevicollis TaxID=83679 RepID=A0AAE0P396_SORBR|nr:hypothetical protein B0T20DRAFT_472448 [Sordaria brevicollis]
MATATTTDKTTPPPPPPTTTTTTPTTFHLFPLLPYELRALIWRFTVVPRVVDVYMPETPSNRTTLSSTPIPGPLHTCRESRLLLTTIPPNTKSENFQDYEKAFQLSPHSPHVAPNPGYIWLNFSLDTVDITSTDLHCFTDPVIRLSDPSQVRRIKRLKLEREYSATYHGEYFFHTEVRQIQAFQGLEEIEFVCLDGMWAFEDITVHNQFPCGSENVWLVDGETGEKMRAVELDRRCEREWEEREGDGGGGERRSFW